MAAADVDDRLLRQPVHRNASLRPAGPDERNDNRRHTLGADVDRRNGGTTTMDANERRVRGITGDDQFYQHDNSPLPPPPPPPINQSSYTSGGNGAGGAGVPPSTQAGVRFAPSSRDDDLYAAPTAAANGANAYYSAQGPQRAKQPTNNTAPVQS